MENIPYYLTLALSGLAAISIVSLICLKGFHGWLDLKKSELTLQNPAHEPQAATPTMSRIDIADLKERVRKLEAIAAGVDL